MGLLRTLRLPVRRSTFMHSAVAAVTLEGNILPSSVRGFPSVLLQVSSILVVGEDGHTRCH